MIIVALIILLFSKNICFERLQARSSMKTESSSVSSKSTSTSSITDVSLPTGKGIVLSDENGNIELWDMTSLQSQLNAIIPNRITDHFNTNMALLKGDKGDKER